MARIRSVHPGQWTSGDFLECSPLARLLAVAIRNFADDNGIFRWKPKTIKAECLPGDDCAISPLLDELLLHGQIKKYEVGGKEYGIVIDFLQWQRPKKPTYLHPAPDWFSTDSEISPQREEVGGSSRKEIKPTTTESLERVAPTTASEPPAPPSETLSPDLKIDRKQLRTTGLRALGTELPADWTPSEEICESCKVDFGMTDDDLRTELPAFHAYNAKNAVRSGDWNQTFYLWGKRWREHRDRQPKPRVEVSRAPPFVPTESDWHKAAQLYVKSGRWPRDHGPDPLSPACKCPPEILEQHGIDPKTGARLKERA